MLFGIRRSVILALALGMAGCEANLAPLGPEEGPTRVVMEVGSSAIYTELGAFLAAAPGVVVEDFEGTRVDPESAAACPGPLDSTTDNACFAPGAIVEGIWIDPPTVTNLAVLRGGFLEGLAGTAVGPDFFGAQAEIGFGASTVNAVGFTLVAPVGGPGNVLVEAWGTEGDLLQSFDAPVGELTGLFHGIISGESISRLTFTPPSGLGLLFDEIWFGTASLEEEPGAAGIVVQVEQGAINPRSQGVIPVSLLTTDDFDATRVDPATVRFGPGEAAPHRAAGKVSDVNGDGRPDMVLHFSTVQAGFACGDTEASMAGRTLDGIFFEGTAHVRVLCLPDRGGPGSAGGGRR